eukprot:jgi/Chlat1/3716/Chrsp255S03870
MVDTSGAIRFHADLQHGQHATGYCLYGTSGVKRISVMVSLDGVEASKSLDMTVTSIAPSRATQPDIKPYDAYASSASNDAQKWPVSVHLIESLYGDRTIADALRISSTPAAAALLNAGTVYCSVVERIKDIHTGDGGIAFVQLRDVAR